MGLRVHVYRHPLGDCTNDGLSARFDHFVVVNIPGPFEPNERAPALALVDDRPLGDKYPKLVPVNADGSRLQLVDCVGPMFGGNYAGASDARCQRAVAEAGGGPFGLLPIFDRFEDHAEAYA